MSNYKQQRGILLIEALVAITVVIIALAGIFTLISRSISLNRVVSDQYVGTYLASEGIEVVKNLIDTNVAQCKPWNEGIGSPGSITHHSVSYDSETLGYETNTPLRYDKETGLYSYGSGLASKFSRVIVIDQQNDGETMQVNSIVTWETRGGGDFEVNAEDHFYNWRPLSANCQ